ncbi:glycosyltransferase family 87 protein [Paracoccus binzhouensis]|uniref:glycosyltransferase family 87 protein n=1 Tax=Paracoccus binzhouensis TaxID=2796149 RepID=UPI0018EEEEAA|nr:glycosyltransferase family 87 protein [Paracoccus binzhouensis]
MLLLAIVALTLFGYAGLARGPNYFSFDALYFYVSGEMWEKGTTPYDPAAFKAQMDRIVNIYSVSYAYPPNSAPFALSLSAGSIRVAQVIIGAINLAAILGILAFVHGAIRQEPSGGDVPERQLRAAEIVTWAVIIGNPFTAHVVWMGQTTLFSAAFLLGSWLLASRRLDLLAGILLGIAAIKPQLVFLTGIWFLLDRRWQLVAASALTVVLMSSWPLWVNGLEGSWLAWIRSLTDYKDGAYNALAFKHVFGLRSLLATQDVLIPSSLPVALLCTLLLYGFRRHYQGIWLIGPLLALSVLFVYAHDYDLAPLAVMAFPLLMAARGRPLVMGAIVLSAFVIYFPQRIWESLDLAEFARSREVALLALLSLYLAVCRVAGPEKRSEAVS